ncbi:hypothetical protein ACK8P5_26255 (plasmid) [Paenibacillus sp. EC2-1]|uniref:hypothetical protein n=1 Tax=Paenibacillus sp. EC2-1 TaxID=3388665 RepID=UPI003BEF10C7
MDDNKQLGAKVMFDQSIVYLYNSYREQGLSHDEAQRRVVSDMDEVRTKHQGTGVLSSAVATDEAVRLIGSVISDIDKMYRTPPLAIRQVTSKLKQAVNALLK